MECLVSSLSPYSVTGIQLSVEHDLGDALIGHLHKVSGPADMCTLYVMFHMPLCVQRCRTSVFGGTTCHFRVAMSYRQTGSTGCMYMYYCDDRIVGRRPSDNNQGKSMNQVHEKKDGGRYRKFSDWKVASRYMSFQ